MNWYEEPLDARAKAGGEMGVNGATYKGGEFLPFYIPRAEMPQVDEKDYPHLITFISSNKCGPRFKTLRPNVLRAHQRVDWDKVKAMQINLRALLKPILASKDHYVLDGNHRWHAAVLARKELKVIEIELEFETAIALLFKFPGTYSYGDGNYHPETS